MAENPLARLPLLGQLAVALVVALLIVGVFYYAVWDDMAKQEDAKNTELSTLQADIRSLDVTANKLQEFQREVALREAKLEMLKRILPADKETPELMKKVQDLATQSNLSVKKFTPGATVNKEFPVELAPGQAPPKPAQTGKPAAAEYYQEWPINLDLTGSYHNLGMFFDRVGRLSRLVNVGGLKIKSQTQPRPANTISVSCVATTFVYVEAQTGGSAAGGLP